MDSPIFERCKCKIGAQVPKGEGECIVLSFLKKLDEYDPKTYNVTDKATQPNVIGYAIAASTDAINVLLV